MYLIHTLYTRVLTLCKKNKKKNYTQYPVNTYNYTFYERVNDIIALRFNVLRYEIWPSIDLCIKFFKFRFRAKRESFSAFTAKFRIFTINLESCLVWFKWSLGSSYIITWDLLPVINFMEFVCTLNLIILCLPKFSIVFHFECISFFTIIYRID